MSVGLQGLLTIVAIVAVSPFVARLFGGRLPTVALLMLGGIAVGPSGLALVQQDPAIDLFAKIGLGLIFALRVPRNLRDLPASDHHKKMPFGIVAADHKCSSNAILSAN
ncbi:hypothetical protein KBY83_11625 [Cyanobium sp. WKJ7-Wakatipu]|uniref:hypothetical protein n=1 Tax=Cyanobium sp. WKJ7-Wakatipu TaxID=2823726 RepID=UPI0020CC02C4|nr:hypothetical protein [Cyanobium sp. WKJ7-Wakatipu]MCP9783956.1 hypothetical protein [Cyanobium sp. WKJ7-Wakatipu]